MAVIFLLSLRNSKFVVSKWYSKLISRKYLLTIRRKKSRCIQIQKSIALQSIIDSCYFIISIRWFRNKSDRFLLLTFTMLLFIHHHSHWSPQLNTLHNFIFMKLLCNRRKTFQNDQGVTPIALPSKCDRILQCESTFGREKWHKINFLHEYWLFKYKTTKKGHPIRLYRLVQVIDSSCNGKLHD